MGHLSLIVFPKCVVMPRFFGGYWGGSVDNEDDKLENNKKKSKSVNKR